MPPEYQEGATVCYVWAMELKSKQLRFLRSRAQPLPVRLSLGKQGASDGFRRELDRALTEQELVKIRIGRQVRVWFTSGQYSCGLLGSESILSAADEVDAARM